VPLGTLAFALPGNLLAYLSMPVLATGMVTPHSVLSASLNHVETHLSGVLCQQAG
jgi:hypothetical protein